jgi:hypothetical protein
MKKLLAIGAAIIASVTIATQSNAGQSGGQLTSFFVTNLLQGTGGLSNIVSWPTNTALTNNTFGTTGASTGQAVSIGAFEHVGITVQGLWVFPTALAGTNGSVTVTLVTAQSTSSPNTVLASNAWSNSQVVTNQNDWCMPAQGITLVLTPTAGVQTNWLNFQTNLDLPSLAGDANWIGVYQIQNDLGSTGFITNFTIGVNTKLLPKPLQ